MASQLSASRAASVACTQSLTFGGIFDALRHSDMRIQRHQHEIATRQRNVGRQPRTFCRDRIFRDLNQQRLTFVNEIANILLHRIRFGDADAGRIDVAGVQKSRSRQADVDERRLHAGQNPFDATFINVAGEAVGAGALQMHFGQCVILDRAPHGFRTR